MNGEAAEGISCPNGCSTLRAAELSLVRNRARSARRPATRSQAAFVEGTDRRHKIARCELLDSPKGSCDPSRWCQSEQALARHDQRVRLVRAPPDAAITSNSASLATTRACTQEIFGPVLSVQVFDTLDEAIALANGTAYALVAGVFTRDFSDRAPARPRDRRRAGLHKRILRRRHRGAVRRQPGCPASAARRGWRPCAAIARSRVLRRQDLS